MDTFYHSSRPQSPQPVIPAVSSPGVNPFLNYECMVLTRFYGAAFILVPVHIGIIVVALLCSNYDTYRFGKGMMPKAYRLSLNHMAVIIDNYTNQLAEQYGTNVATEILARSRSNVQLYKMQKMPYVSSGGNSSAYHAGYNSLESWVPEGAS